MRRKLPPGLEAGAASIRAERCGDCRASAIKNFVLDEALKVRCEVVDECSNIHLRNLRGCTAGGNAERVAALRIAGVDALDAAFYTAFLLGLRASEVTDRVVRDLDDNGRLLWIEFGKTKRSRRTLEIPALLRPYLLSLAKDRPVDAQLISRTISPCAWRQWSALEWRRPL